jgi:DNA modification methylase
MKKIRFKFPCILEVSQTESFIEDPHMKSNKTQVCIGKLGGKFVCVQSEQEHTDWMLKQINHSINSGGISGLVLEYWNYARKINKT